LLDYDDGESLEARQLEGTFNNNAVGSWRLDLDYAQEPATMEESPSDEGAEDHEAGGNSIEEKVELR
jgi:hypothetical protein